MMWIVIPGWEATKEILWNIPCEAYRRWWEDGQEHFHAKVNIGTEREEDLCIEDWELS